MNLRSQVKNCPRVSLICLSESGRKGPILSGCDKVAGPDNLYLVKREQIQDSG